jgi:hypothetical protein
VHADLQARDVAERQTGRARQSRSAFRLIAAPRVHVIQTRSLSTPLARVEEG